MKKGILTIISAIVISSMICTAVCADDIAVQSNTPEVYNIFLSGTAGPGYTLTADFDLSDSCDRKATVIKWYRNGVEIPDADEEVYTLKKDDAEQQINVGITPISRGGSEGTEMFSDVLDIAPSLEMCHVKNGENISQYNENAKEENNPAYVFGENGYKYTYLAAEKEGMYVICDDVAGRVKLAVSPENNYFNPEDTTTIAYWLNHDYLEGSVGSNGKKINPHVADYLNVREYLTEGNGISGAANCDDYVVKCKVALPAFYELAYEYSDIIGYRPSNAAYYTIFRTPISNSITGCPNLKADTGALGVTTVTTPDKNYTNLTLRPCMLIDYSFFRQYKLDMDMGDEVKNFLLSNFTRSELSEAGYTEDELEQIGYADGILNIENFVMTGFRSAGQMLTMQMATDFPKDADVKYSWYFSDEKDGEYRKIYGAESENYVIEKRYFGKYLKAKAEIYDSVTGEKYGTAECVSEKILQADSVCVVPEAFDAETGSGSFDVINNTDGAVDIYFIIAAYDSENRMTGCTAESTSVETGESTVELSVRADDACMYRLMAWDSYESARLLCAMTVN